MGPPVAYLHLTPLRLRSARVSNTPVRCKLPRKIPGSAALQYPAANTSTAMTGTRRRIVLIIDKGTSLEMARAGSSGGPAVRRHRATAAPTRAFIVSGRRRPHRDTAARTKHSLFQGRADCTVTRPPVQGISLFQGGANGVEYAPITVPAIRLGRRHGRGDPVSHHRRLRLACHRVQTGTWSGCCRGRRIGALHLRRRPRGE